MVLDLVEAGLALGVGAGVEADDAAIVFLEAREDFVSVTLAETGIIQPLFINPPPAHLGAIAGRAQTPRLAPLLHARGLGFHDV